MATSRIEAFLWSSGVAGAQDATQSLTVIEPGPVSETVTLAEGGRVFADALTQFAALLNALGTLSGTYSLTWDASAAAVTISASGVASFEVQFSGNLHKAFGFATATGHSGATSYTGSVQALARYDAIRVDCDVLSDGSIVTAKRSRRGRHRAIAWGNHDKYRATMKVPRGKLAGFAASYCGAPGAKIRLYPNDGDTTAYSATNGDGYVDGWIVDVDRFRPLGGREDFAPWWLQSFTLAVARA